MLENTYAEARSLQMSGSSPGVNIGSSSSPVRSTGARNGNWQRTWLRLRPCPTDYLFCFSTAPTGRLARHFGFHRSWIEGRFTPSPDGARCASACASIVFIAGKTRTVEDRGSLGQHSCSRGGVPDEACNKAISRHAVKHGVSHGSIAAFVTYVAPESILWSSREDAEGWGLTNYPTEDLSGFVRSEPRVLKVLTGEMPLA